ncbi:uncharacterized protein LOC144605881 isoform X2 [Rhinoraja longicauda]
MGCTSSIATVKPARQHPDIQINVIEPSTLTAVHSDTHSSVISVTQSSRHKASDTLQVTGIKKYGRCHSAVSRLGEPSRMFDELQHPASDCGRDTSSLLKRSQSAKLCNSEHGFCSHSAMANTRGTGNSSKRGEKRMEGRPHLESEQLDSLSLKED